MPLVTNIQRYSIHDGDGIRTTVFFKGCPLNCVWCHNPETQCYNKQILTNQEKCVGCGECMKVCPMGAISIKAGKAETDQSLCNGCGKCVTACLLNLREVAGKEYSVKELITELKKDEMFYEESGGGITLSGGEVMVSDMEYIAELAQKLHGQGFTVAVDTSGYAPYENFEKILPYVDTFLYDIKAIDREVHTKYIGVDNELILDNLEKLSRDNAKLYIRIPVIKGVNEDDESMQAVIDWLIDHHIKAIQVNLLPYHNTGSSKYARMEGEYEGEHLETPGTEEMEHILTMFQNAGFHNTKIGG